MNNPKITSTAELTELVNEELFQLIERAVNAYAAIKNITLGEVEITIAAFLGTCIGDSCANQVEAIVNCSAYSDFIRSIAMNTLGEKQTPESETVN